MEGQIYPLEPERAADFFAFFDDVAFSDHPEWAFCYCTYYHRSDEEGRALDEAHKGEPGDWPRRVLRACAAERIASGGMRGYLAYAGGRVVAWCNVNDKGAFGRLCASPELWDEGENAKIKAVTCFIVAPEHRRKGLASALLRRAAEDAAAKGYDFLEAYPQSGEHDQFEHYHGHPAMFARCGFAPHKALEGYAAYRLALKGSEARPVE
ncbi:MAG: GNAT family N-acetyltransferase [Christensenellaceae bacterium]|jgi:GNAT superfamily N-acetyltransferase|nr:GNAT family N-acetyltransferase [Christensenellaceae bacterium]